MKIAPPKLPCPVVELLEPGSVATHLREQSKPVDAVPTPLDTWNRNCRDDGGGRGLARGWHVTGGANTGIGKSLLALNLAASAIEHGEHVGFASLEMSRTQVATRLYAIITGRPVRQIERGDGFDPGAGAGLARKIAEIRERTGGSFWVNDRPIAEIETIQGLMRYFAESKGCRFFVVDYLQLAAARDADSLFQQVTNVSARVREFAKTFGVTTVGFSQLNRETSSNYTDRPRVQGLMGGSPLENDSDQVVLLDHTRYVKHDHTARTWLLLGKNRHGSNVEIPIEWDYRTLRIREALPDEEAEWPAS